MTIEGIDYAWERPDPAGLYAAGKRFACRYLSYNTTGKNITKSERDALFRAGLAICLNWENRANDADDGYSGGRTNAQTALSQANALGFPSDLPIYFSVDQDTGGNPSMIDSYFRGIRSVLPLSRIGVYGGLATVRRACEQNLATWLWQTYAWSGGVWYVPAHVRQYHNGVTVAGGDVDLDRAMVADYGQWTGGDMALTDADAEKVATAVWYRDVDPTADKLPAWIALDQARDAASAAVGRLDELLARPATPVVQVDLGALADALASNSGFAVAIARAVADEFAARLQS